MISGKLWKGFETKFVLAPAVIVGVAAYLSYVYSSEIQKIIVEVYNVDIEIIIFILFLSVINYTIRFFRWSYFVSKTEEGLSFFRHFLIYIAGFALTATPGKVGEAMRMFYLKPFGISHQRCLAGVYAERLYDMIVISILAMLIFTTSGVVGRSLGLAGAGLAMMLVAVQHPAVSALVERVTVQTSGPWMKSFSGAVAGFLSDVRSMMAARIAVIGLGSGLLAWGAEGLATWLVVRSLGLDIGIAPAIGIYATAMLAGALSFLPGGLGSAEVVMVSLFVYAGAPVTSAVAATAIIRLATLWFAIVLGLAAWLYIEMFRGRKRVDGGEQQGEQ